MKASKICKNKKVYKMLMAFILLVLIIIIFIIIVQSTRINQKKYVTFNTDGGSVIEKTEILDNGKISIPANPTKDNFIFNGWFKESTLDNYIDLKSTIFNDNITIYARYISYFDFAFFEGFYNNYLYDLENNYYSNRSLLNYMNDHGQTTLTNEILTSFIALQIKTTSEPEVKNLFSEKVETIDLKESQIIPCNIETYLNSDGEFYLSNNKYININNQSDIRDTLDNPSVYKRASEFYINKPKTKVFIKIIEKETLKETYINVLDSKEKEDINALDEISFVGQLKYYNNNFYIDYNPYISGYKTNDFLEYFDDCMNYFLFERVFNDYHTYQYERLMLQVYYLINPEKENYSKSRLEASQKVVQKIYRNFIDFEKYNQLEEEIQKE